MVCEKHAYSVLLVAARESFAAALREHLPERLYQPVHQAESAAQARRRLLERSYDLVLINAPLPDEFGRSLADDAVENQGTVALLLVNGDLYGEICEQAALRGILLLKKPTTPSLLEQSLDTLRAVRERLRRLEKKTRTLEERMAEIRLVNRAKWALIARLGLSEQEAHRHLEKQAMDRCMSKVALAREILEKEGQGGCIEDGTV